jgi:hypothetical protein
VLRKPLDVYMPMRAPSCPIPLPHVLWNPQACAPALVQSFDCSVSDTSDSRRLK